MHTSVTSLGNVRGPFSVQLLSSAVFGNIMHKNKWIIAISTGGSVAEIFFFRYFIQIRLNTRK